MSQWLETYRGTVSRWEVDHNDHFTVAYYFQRFDDATQALLTALGLDPAVTAREGRAAVTVDAHVRYVSELRAGDIMHVTSGVIAVADDALVLGHKLLDSAADVVCATVEQRVRHVAIADRTPWPLPAASRGAAESLAVTWDVPARERRPQPRGTDGFRESARDVVRPWEVNVLGRAALAAYIHRFSAANGHAIAAFGMTPAYMRDERRGFSTFEFQLTVPGELVGGEPVVVRSALVHVGTSSVRVFHAMSSARTGDRVATLEQFGVHLDMDARRPTPLPDAIREKARALLVPTVP